MPFQDDQQFDIEHKEWVKLSQRVRPSTPGRKLFSIECVPYMCVFSRCHRGSGPVHQVESCSLYMSIYQADCVLFITGNIPGRRCSLYTCVLYICVLKVSERVRPITPGTILFSIECFLYMKYAEPQCYSVGMHTREKPSDCRSLLPPY
jgi:hypothetical protein